MNRHFPKEDIHEANKHEKKLNITDHWRNVNQNRKTGSLMNLALLPGMSAVAQSWLTATSTFQVQVILLPQTSKHGGACLWSQLLGRLRQDNHLSPGVASCRELLIVQLHPSLSNRLGLMSEDEADGSQACLDLTSRGQKTTRSTKRNVSVFPENPDIGKSISH
ncbi:hypothetical protein AAY473_001096, partial [Plecturocebus cupreus]